MLLFLASRAAPAFLHEGQPGTDGDPARNRLLTQEPPRRSSCLCAIAELERESPGALHFEAVFVLDDDGPPLLKCFCGLDLTPELERIPGVVAGHCPV